MSDDTDLAQRSYTIWRGSKDDLVDIPPWIVLDDEERESFIAVAATAPSSTGGG